MTISTTLRRGALVALGLALVGLAVTPPPAAAQPTIPIVSFDFDDGQGGGDPQGWRPYSYYEDDRAHFHVEDFAGPGHEAVPLAGARSMWCGANVGDPETCHWDAPPGYGSNWNENLASVPFAVTGDVTLAFIAHFGMEPGYDYVYVDYEDTTGAWVTLDAHDCGLLPCDPVRLAYTVPAAEHRGTLRFRFHFTSDGAVDSEFAYFGPHPIAFVVDSLTVSDATGIVDYQDFETEAVGDTVTADASWYGERNTDAHSGGILVDGTATLQETTPVNTTWFWGFFGDSDQDYACGGHPEQPVPALGLYLVRSPLIDLTRDAQGQPIQGDADSIRVSFDLYRDIGPLEPKAWTWRVVWYTDGCLSGRDQAPNPQRGDQQDWHRRVVDLIPPVGANGLEFEILLLNPDAGGECASDAPLFDNVTVERFGGGASAAPDRPPRAGPLLVSISPNPFNPRTTIRYDLPRAGVLSLRVYDLAGRLVRTLKAAEPTPAGPGVAVWQGRDDAGRVVASGTYFCRLEGPGGRDIGRMTLVR